MSTYEEIDHAVEILGKENLILMHTCSAYPSQYNELNLRADSRAPAAVRGSRRLLRA